MTFSVDPKRPWNAMFLRETLAEGEVNGKEIELAISANALILTYGTFADGDKRVVEALTFQDLVKAWVESINEGRCSLCGEPDRPGGHPACAEAVRN